MSKLGLDIQELAKMEFSEPWKVMGPWLTENNLTLLYAPRGLGKTHFCTSLAIAIARHKPFLCWKPETAKRVLYVDGEMGPQSMRNMLQRIDPGMGNIPSENFRLLSFDDCGGVIWNLANFYDQHKYDEVMEPYDVVFIDNYLTCIRQTRREYDTELWARVQPWAIKHRQAGRCIVFVHHAGKQPTQLGTSTKENAMNTIVALQPAWQMPGFELHFEKTRDFYGPETKPLYIDFTNTEHGLAWSWKPLEKLHREKVAEWSAKGWTTSEIANCLRINFGLVREYKNEIRENCSGLEKRSRKDTDYDLF